jgi:hypothetical protein
MRTVTSNECLENKRDDLNKRCATIP